MPSTISVELRSNILPPLPLLASDAAPSSGGGFSDWLLGLVRPRIIVSTPLGAIDKAPFGTPGDGTWKLVLAVFAVVVLMVLGLAVRGLLSLLHRK